VRRNTPLEQVVDVMARRKYGCAIVIEGDEVVGIFTTIDALRAFADVLRTGAAAA
jgi:acetoin utilization protein AcuB